MSLKKNIGTSGSTEKSTVDDVGTMAREYCAGAMQSCAHSCECALTYENTTTR